MGITENKKSTLSGDKKFLVPKSPKSICITEKPSVAADIARVLGASVRKNGYFTDNKGIIVTWCVGHLLQAKLPAEQNSAWEKWDIAQLPMLCSKEQFGYKPNESTKEQLAIIKDLLEKNKKGKLFDGPLDIINCGDAGREGELIQRLVQNYCGINESNSVIKRLWISSMDDKSILDGFNNLVDQSNYDNLYEASLCRQQQDYHIGMNFSRLVTLKNTFADKTTGSTFNALFSIGRVQSPTVNIIRQRELEVENFVSAKYYQVKANFSDDYWGILIDPKDNNKIINFDDIKIANSVCDELKTGMGSITGYTTTKKSKQRPPLYNLSGLQIDANKRFGLSADETLKIAQSLYETHKITTYPRTDSEYLTSNQASSVQGLVNAIIEKSYPEVAKTSLGNGITLDKRVIDDKKVSDHHAIIINRNYKCFDESVLSPKEKAVLGLITQRMLISFSAPYLYNETEVITNIKGYVFRSFGQEPLSLGWRETATVLGAKLKEKSDDSQEFTGLMQGKDQFVDTMETIEKDKTKPKYHTEATLLQAMKSAGQSLEDENLRKILKNSKGLGTEATRAGIIENIQKMGYCEKIKQGKVEYFHTTEKGQVLLSIAPSRLIDPKLSAEWEEAFSEIENGSRTSESFTKEMFDYITDVCKNYIGQHISMTNPIMDKAIGVCPYCKAPVIKGKFGSFCTKKCGFTFGKYRGHEFSEPEKKALVNGKVIIIKDLISQKGKSYAMKIALNPTTFNKQEYNGKTYIYPTYQETLVKTRKPKESVAK